MQESEDMAAQGDEIYLDHNATTPLDPRVLEAMMPYLTHVYASPMSSHAAGRRVARAVEDAREQVARLIGAQKPSSIIFTSGGTESDNAAIFGVAAKAPSDRKRLVTSTIEHAAVTRALEKLAHDHAYTLRLLHVNSACRIDVEQAREVIDEHVALVSLMHANNEVGAIQPIAKVGRLCRDVGAIFHVDGAQAVGKIDVDVDRDCVDLYTIVGHKFYGPKGVGALYLRPGVAWRPSQLGAGHEGGRRAGTHHVPGIIGLGCAAKIAREELDLNQRTMRAMKESLFAMLHAHVPNLHRTYAGEEGGCLPHTLHLCFPGVLGAALLERASIVMASTGAACHKPSDPPSATLTAMGVSPALARGSVRLSLGHGLKEEDLERAASALSKAYHEIIQGV